MIKAHIVKVLQIHTVLFFSFLVLFTLVFVLFPKEETKWLCTNIYQNQIITKCCHTQISRSCLKMDQKNLLRFDTFIEATIFQVRRSQPNPFCDMELPLFLDMYYEIFTKISFWERFSSPYNVGFLIAIALKKRNSNCKSGQRKPTKVRFYSKSNWREYWKLFWWFFTFIWVYFIYFEILKTQFKYMCTYIMYVIQTEVVCR